MNDIKIPSIVRLKKGITEEELNDYMEENDDGSFFVYLRYKYDFEEEWTYSIECAFYDYCMFTVCWLNDWYEGQQNVEYLAISKLGEEYDSWRADWICWGRSIMIYFIAGFFFGGIAAMMLYSIVVSERINNLEYQNERLMFELESKKKELVAYRCMYASSYDGFEETK